MHLDRTKIARNTELEKVMATQKNSHNGCVVTTKSRKDINKNMVVCKFMIEFPSG
jgi:hypothetical protein